ncbi:MAG: V-type ATP synthase subunit D [Spirochaetes bacterium]|nr:V-type ATP synthase subunit D [Spirochaetota bacterium]
MARIDVPPTKSSLRKIKTDLAFAREGFDLLEQKREILVMEIMKNVKSIKAIEERVATTLETLYASFKSAVIEMGSDIMVQKSHSEKEVYALSLDVSRFIGISIPAVRLDRKEITVNSSLYGTTALYDRCKTECSEMLALLAEYSAIMKSILVLSRELKKVQRKVNALEKIFIPQNEEAGKYISDRLEEMEREEIFVKKLIKQKQA